MNQMARGRHRQPEKERKVRELSQTDTKAVTRKASNTLINVLHLFIMHMSGFTNRNLIL